MKNNNVLLSPEQLKNYEEWNEPILLPEEPILLPWPENVFPEPFNSFISELSKSVEVPIELPAMQLLSTIATCVQTKFQVKIKNDYFEPLCLWTLSILPPASRKSKIFYEITKPLRSWEENERLRLNEEVKLAKSKEATLKEMIKQKRILGARPSSNKTFQEIQNEVYELESKFPEIPIVPQLWTTDVTPEHLGVLMKENNEAMAILSDESAVFDILAGLYSDGKINLDIFLQGYSGGPSRVDRKSREQIDLKRTCLTIGLTSQPEVLFKIIKNRTFRGRGLLGRFCYVYPKSNIGTRKLDVPPMQEKIKREYHEAILEILNYCKLDNNDKKQISNLSLSEEGYKHLLEYSQTIEKLMGEELGVLTHITDWAGKLAGNIARIGGLLHIMKYRNTTFENNIIDSQEICSAIKIGHCLKNHALKVFDASGLDGPEQKAKAIFSWLCKWDNVFFTSREFLRSKRGFTKKDFEEGAQLLIDNEIIRMQKISKKNIGRPKDFYFINPYVIGQKGQK